MFDGCTEGYATAIVHEEPNVSVPSEVPLPTGRGPLSSWVIDHLLGGRCGAPPPPGPDQGLDDDLQLALYLCYELHYSTFAGVAADAEWDPELIRFRSGLERAFGSALHTLVGPATITGPISAVIPALIDADDGPSLSSHMETVGTIAQMRQIVLHRSAYQLKEGDGHTFAVPRLRGRAKQLLVEIQAGEYGADAPDRTMHSELFAQTMRSLGLDDRCNAHLDVLPASALAVSNLVSLFGLNRRWRGALVGHLTVFEMTSVEPMGRYSRALERLGASPEARRFYDVHVMADAEHEQLAMAMATALVADEPGLEPDVVFGARCSLAIDARFGAALMAGWSAAHVDTRAA